MDQHSYELIMSCIQHGAPAVAPQLINALNVVVEKANQLTELQRAKLEEARKAEAAKKDAEEQAKKEAAVKSTDTVAPTKK